MPDEFSISSVYLEGIIARFKIVGFSTFFIYSLYQSFEEVISMRKDVYERMRYFVIEKIKPNYSTIARQYDVDPRTVKAAYLRVQSGESNS